MSDEYNRQLNEKADLLRRITNYEFSHNECKEAIRYAMSEGDWGYAPHYLRCKRDGDVRLDKRIKDSKRKRDVEIEEERRSRVYGI